MRERMDCECGREMTAGVDHICKPIDRIHRTGERYTGDQRRIVNQYRHAAMQGRPIDRLNYETSITVRYQERARRKILLGE